MSTNILYIWDSDYPWDVRTEKICRSLINHGYEVHIAARNLKRRAVYEKLDGIHVHRMRTWTSEKLNYALSFPAFFSPIWKRFISGIIRKCDIRLVIVRDLPLAPLGINCARRFGIPCIFDMAEDYVAMIRDIWNARKWQGLNLVVRNPYLAKLVEHYAFKKADHIFVVVEEAIDVVIKGGGDSDKVSIVSNTPELKAIIKNDVDNREIAGLAKIRDRFSAIYVGGIQMGRGIQTVLDAIPEILKEIPNLLFVVVGDGYASDYFRDLIKKRQLDDYVYWAGWIDHERIYSYIKACKIGIIPHLVTDHVNTTVPNKIFDYMAQGLPVIATDSLPMKRLIDHEQCGLYFRSGDSMDLAKKCVQVQKSRSIYGENGRRAVFSKYNWKNDEHNLVTIVKQLMEYSVTK